jgi:hypothetical protein
MQLELAVSLRISRVCSFSPESCDRALYKKTDEGEGWHTLKALQARYQSRSLFGQKYEVSQASLSSFFTRLAQYSAGAVGPPEAAWTFKEGLAGEEVE